MPSHGCSTLMTSVQRPRQACVFVPSRGCSTPGWSVPRSRLTIVLCRVVGPKIAKRLPRISSKSFESSFGGTRPTAWFRISCQASIRVYNRHAFCSTAEAKRPSAPRQTSSGKAPSRPRSSPRCCPTYRHNRGARLISTPANGGAPEYDPERPSLNFSATLNS